MVFVRRAATVALLTFAGALAGFGVHGFLPLTTSSNPEAWSDRWSGSLRRYCRWC
jgi:hypothetical protein